MAIMTESKQQKNPNSNDDHNKQDKNETYKSTYDNAKSGYLSGINFSSKSSSDSDYLLAYDSGYNDNIEVKELMPELRMQRHPNQPLLIVMTIFMLEDITKPTRV